MIADQTYLVKLADELDGWHDCADGDVSDGNGHFRVVCESDSEQQRLNLRATLREASTALRRLASSDSGVKGEPVRWEWLHPHPIDGTDIWRPEQYWNGYTSKTSRPLYTAPPADAGMREAFIRVLASLAAAISILERTPKAKKAVASDKMFDTMLDDYRKALEAGRKALTAPGATTKSDVEALAATTAERPGAVTSEPEPSTSDPSPARSDVTVGELARFLDPRAFDEGAEPNTQIRRRQFIIEKARALLETHEIRRK